MKVEPVLWAVISSWTVSAPTSSPISSRPDPVVPTPRIEIVSPNSSHSSFSPSVTTCTGRPCVPT